jgi:hypothetical protein
VGFTTVPDKSSGDVFTEAMWDTYIKDNFNTGVPVLLADSTVTGSVAASIDLQDIPQDWTHLLLITYLRGDTAASLIQTYMRFNNDSSSNYDSQNVGGNASSATAAEELAQSGVPCTAMPAASAGSNLFGSQIIHIPYYSQASNAKTAVTHAALKTGTTSGSVYMQVRSGFWRSNSAITRITILASTGNLAIGSRVSLYGLP